jgi:phage/plasmid-like protein (TIGR03299 family)
MLATLDKLGNDAKNINSVEDALRLYNMDWTVEVRPTYFTRNDGSKAEMPRCFATVRSDNETMLGRVGADYVPMSNAKSLSHVDSLIHSGAATLDSVFELKNGRQVGASLRLNDKISIAGEDPIEMYIVVTTSHDGTRADKTAIVPIRMWCTNQMALIGRSARQSWSVRHLSTMEANLKFVEEELKLVANYSTWFQKTCDDLVAQALNEVELSAMLLDALSEFRAEEKAKAMTEEIVDLFKYSQLIGDEYRNTAWGGLNAVTEYFDHHKTYRTPQARYNSITSGFGARMRNTVANRLINA